MPRSPRAPSAFAGCSQTSLLEAGPHLIPVTVSIGAALLENGRDAFETLEHAGSLAKSAKQWRNTALVDTPAAPQEAAAR